MQLFREIGEVLGFTPIQGLPRVPSEESPYNGSAHVIERGNEKNPHKNLRLPIFVVNKLIILDILDTNLMIVRLYKH